jgi:hypothetical protein
LQAIATVKVKSVTLDLLDEHCCRSEEEMEAHAYNYDAHPHSGPTKIYPKVINRLGTARTVNTHLSGWAAVKGDGASTVLCADRGLLFVCA